MTLTNDNIVYRGHKGEALAKLKDLASRSGRMRKLRPPKGFLPAWFCPRSETADPAKVKRMTLTPIADEIAPREPFDGYPILQGGIPEVEEFISKLKLQGNPQSHK